MRHRLKISSACIVGLFSANMVFGQIPTDNLCAYYPFNGNTLDASMLLNHATAAGGMYVEDRFGNSNAAFYLDGINDSIVAPIGAFAPIVGDFSISFWFKTSSPERMNVFSSKQFTTDTTNNFEFQFTSNTINQPILELQYASFTYWNGTGSDYLNNMSEGNHGQYYNGKWHHYVLQRKNDTIQLWHNKNTQYPALITYYDGTLGDAVDFIIGAGEHYLNGTIDDIAFYNRNITPDEISTLFHDNQPYVFLSPKATDAYVQGDTAIINWHYNSNAVSDSIYLTYQINGSGDWLSSEQNNLVDWTPFLFPMNFPIGTTIEFKIQDVQDENNFAYTGQFRVSEYKWENVVQNLPFTNRDGSGLLNFNDKLWLLGGWDPPYHEATNYTHSEVWNSEDGITWNFVNEAPWIGRHCSGWLVFDHAMWVIGGDPQSGSISDVWKSEDGINWTQLLDTIPAFEPQRTMHQVASLNGKIFNFGGQQIDYVEGSLNQVWQTTDGSNWTQLPNAPWQGRGAVLNSCVDDAGNMWLLGGGRLWDRRCYNDVWKTSDGINWDLITASAPWAPRYWHNVAWFDNKMWVINGVVNQTDNAETWYSENGIDWYELKHSRYQARHAAALTVKDNSIWLMTGILTNDVWKLNNQLTIGIAELAPTIKANAIVAPNPFNVSAILNIDANLFTTPLNLCISNATGQLIRVQKITDATTTIERNNLPAGWYSYAIFNNNAIVASGKFVIN